MLRTGALSLRRVAASLGLLSAPGQTRENVLDGAVALLDARRALSSGTTEGASEENIVAAVVVERLPVVLPKLAPPLEAFESFSYWERAMSFVKGVVLIDHTPCKIVASSWSFVANPTSERGLRCRDCWKLFTATMMELVNVENLNGSSSIVGSILQNSWKHLLAGGDDEGEAAFEPASTVTEADEANDRRSLERALDRRLYLLIRGFPYGGSKDTPVWHFPEKEYGKEESLRKCAEAVTEPFISNPADLYFVGNAPCGHMTFRLSAPSYKRFFFKSQLIAGKVNVKGKKIRDYAWVSKAELSEYLDPSETEYMKKLLLE